MSNKWVLSWGIHRHTIGSRDAATEECEDVEDCKKKLRDKEKFYNDLGYVIWFAEAISPENEKFVIHPGDCNY